MSSPITCINICTIKWIMTHTACNRLNSTFQFTTRIISLQFLNCIIQMLSLQFVSFLWKNSIGNIFLYEMLIMSSIKSCVKGRIRILGVWTYIHTLRVSLNDFAPLFIRKSSRNHFDRTLGPQQCENLWQTSLIKDPHHVSHFLCKKTNKIFDFFLSVSVNVKIVKVQKVKVLLNYTCWTALSYTGVKM